MEIRVLGASGGCAAGSSPSCYLVDGKLSVDAGSIASALTLAEQAKVEAVLLTHSHLDHVRDLPLLIINGDRRKRPLAMHGLPAALQSVRRHVLNAEIWYDPFLVPEPPVKSIPIGAGESAVVAGFRVTGFPLRHTVDSSGWLVEDEGGAVFFSGDTGQEDALEAVVAAAGPRLKAVLLEASFPDAMAEFARLTGHLTPAGLGRCVRVLPPHVPVYVTHMKPGHEERITAEIAALGNPALRPLRGGEVLRA